MSALLHGTSVDPTIKYTDVILTSEVHTAAKFVLSTATNLTNTPVMGTQFNGHKRLLQKYEPTVHGYDTRSRLLATETRTEGNIANQLILRIHCNVRVRCH